jgi:hypothetical protein
MSCPRQNKIYQNAELTHLGARFGLSYLSVGRGWLPLQVHVTDQFLHTSDIGKRAKIENVLEADNRRYELFQITLDLTLTLPFAIPRTMSDNLMLQIPPAKYLVYHEKQSFLVSLCLVLKIIKRIQI